MLKRLVEFLRRGPRHVAKRIYVRAFGPAAPCFRIASPHLAGKGIEVGGPSTIFQRRQWLPVYPIAGSLDGCNYSNSSVWEGEIAEGRNYRFGNRVGYQYICDAAEIRVADGAYDFLISSHMIEHSANPIRVLNEWRRVICEGGHLMLVVPDGRLTWDRIRGKTTMRHLVDDFVAETGEDDTTHLAEVLAVSEPNAEFPTREALRDMIYRNFDHRMVHQHVFDQALVEELVRHAGFEVLASETADPFHIIVFARKLTH